MGISLNPATLLNGQGIDVSSVVDQILSQNSGELYEWQSEQATLKTQTSDLTSINTDLTNLATTVAALADPLGALTAQTATSSNTGILTATSNSAAAAGTDQIVVNNLATAGAVNTTAFAGGADASFLTSGNPTGEIDLNVSGTTHAIDIAAGSNDTVNSLASFINAQGWGVTASVVSDSTGSRLVLVNQATGTPSTLAVSNNTHTNLNFNAPTAGVNAALTVNGIPLSSTSNTLTGAITGVTLNLASAAPGSPVTLTVGPATIQATQAINNFVNAYNQVIGDINTQYTVSASTNTEGSLGADSSLRQLQSSLLSDAAYSISGNSGYVNLSSLGITTNNDGTLSVVTTATDSQISLSQALATNPGAFQNFFQNSSQSGFANNFNSDLVNLTDPTEGPLNVDLSQNAVQQQNLATNIDNFETQVAAEQTQLTAELDSVNSSLQAYPLLLQQITETLGTLGTGGSTNSTNPTLTSGL
jgi:flagellar hook-associated protein 2